MSGLFRLFVENSLLRWRESRIEARTLYVTLNRVNRENKS